MKTKQPASSKKQPVALRDLKTAKNPKGGAIGIPNTGPRILTPSGRVTLSGGDGNDLLSGRRGGC